MQVWLLIVITIIIAIRHWGSRSLESLTATAMACLGGMGHARGAQSNHASAAYTRIPHHLNADGTLKNAEKGAKKTGKDVLQFAEHVFGMPRRSVPTPAHCASMFGTQHKDKYNERAHTHARAHT